MKRPPLRRPRAVLALALVLAALAPACVEPLADPQTATSSPLVVGERREITLRALRFDVDGYERRLTRADLLALPDDVRQRLWLLDLPLVGGVQDPRVLERALQGLADADPSTLSPAAQNMQRLLAMTPATADLSGTTLAPLVAVAPLVGVAPERVLADALGIDPADPFLAQETLAAVLAADLIGSHPAAQQRPGPRTPDNPDGLYPVAPNSLPITLEDVLTDFGTLAARFGPVEDDRGQHPGFLVGEVRAPVLGPDFAITVRARANAMPYEGVDLTDASRATVRSIASQIQGLFDFQDPAWLQIEGWLPGTPRLSALTFQVREADTFLAAGTAPVPRPTGNGAVWQQPPWVIERLVAQAALQTWATRTAQAVWTFPDRPDPLLSVGVTDGWMDVRTAGGIGDPPPPTTIWDLLSEVAQVRLHDGGLAEGDANVAVTLRDVPIGLTTEDLAQTIRENLEANPALLQGVAERLVDASRGAADVYYTRTDGPDAADLLVFVAPDDLERDAAGALVRPYGYARPGFFADPSLVTPRGELGGDGRQTVVVVPGDVLYVADDTGARYRLTVGDKPSRARIGLVVERIQEQP